MYRKLPYLPVIALMSLGLWVGGCATNQTGAAEASASRSVTSGGAVAPGTRTAYIDSGRDYPSHDPDDHASWYRWSH